MCNTPCHSKSQNTNKPSISTSSSQTSRPTEVNVTLEGGRPFPKAASRPYENGKKKVKACIFTKNEEVINEIWLKNEKKMKKEKKNNAGSGKKKRGPQQNKLDQKPHFTDEEEVDIVRMLMNDSSKYSVKLEEEATWT